MNSERLARLRRAMGIEAPRARVKVGPDLIEALRVALASGSAARIQNAVDAFDDGTPVPPELQAAALAALSGAAPADPMGLEAIRNARGALTSWSPGTGKRPGTGRARELATMRARMGLDAAPGTLANYDAKGRRCWPAMGPAEFRGSLLRAAPNTLTEGQRRARAALLAA